MPNSAASRPEPVLDQASTFSLPELPHHPINRIVPPPPLSWQCAVSATVEDCYQYLMSSAPEAARLREMLCQMGIPDPLIADYQIGYNRQARVINWRHENGVVTRLRLPQGLLIPWMGDNALWAVRILPCNETTDLKRRLQASGGFGQAQFVKGSKPILFNADHLMVGRPALFVQCELDAILGQSVLEQRAAVVTFAGAWRFPDQWRSALERCSTLVACLDDRGLAKHNLAKLRRSFPIHEQPLPEYVVVQYGFLLDWFGDLKLPTTSGVPNGIRSAALYLKLHNALIVYELVRLAIMSGCLMDGERFTASKLMAINVAAKIGLSSALIYRGLKQGLNVFFAKLDGYSSDKDSISSDSAKNKAGRPQTVYHLIEMDEICEDLKDSISWAAMEKHFPATRKSVLVPKLFPEQLEGLVKSLHVDSVGIDWNLLQQGWNLVVSKQDQDLLNEIMGKARKDIRKLLEGLESPHSTPLPLGWCDGSKYRALYVRAQFDEATKARRSYSDLSRNFGVRPSSVPALLRRAGLENVQESQFEHWEISPDDDIKEFIKETLWQIRGRPYQVTIVRGQTMHVYPWQGKVTDLLRAALANAQYVVISFRVASQQRVISDALPPTPHTQPLFGKTPKAAKSAASAQKPHSRRTRRKCGLRSGFTFDWSHTHLKQVLVRLMLLAPEDTLEREDVGPFLRQIEGLAREHLCDHLKYPAKALPLPKLQPRLSGLAM